MSAMDRVGGAGRETTMRGINDPIYILVVAAVAAAAVAIAVGTDLW